MKFSSWRWWLGVCLSYVTKYSWIGSHRTIRTECECMPTHSHKNAYKSLVLQQCFRSLTNVRLLYQLQFSRLSLCIWFWRKSSLVIPIHGCLRHTYLQWIRCRKTLCADIKHIGKTSRIQAKSYKKNTHEDEYGTKEQRDREKRERDEEGRKREREKQREKWFDITKSWKQTLKSNKKIYALHTRHSIAMHKHSRIRMLCFSHSPPLHKGNSIRQRNVVVVVSDLMAQTWKEMGHRTKSNENWPS